MSQPGDRRATRWLAGLALFALAGLPSPVRAETFDILTGPKQIDANTVMWRIDKPNVKQKVTEYKKITYQFGDEVTIWAGGCVQTGGSGKTWKRYVDPQGPNSDRYYHGQVWLPGISGQLGAPVRIKAVMGNRYKIYAGQGSKLTAKDLYLRLGYEDDNYKDNGYWGRAGDDGTGNQCKGLGNTYVIIAIRKKPGGVALTPEMLSPRIPPHQFMNRGAWAFDNFKTAELTWGSFKRGFNLGFWDYINPVTYILQVALDEKLASSGNCFGMCLLAEEMEFHTHYGLPYSGELHEDLWARYKKRDSRLELDINTRHWRQISVEYLRQAKYSLFRSPQTNAERIDADLRARQYGLISITNGWNGHTMIPLAVTRGKDKAGQLTYTIHVYDPNRPYTGSATGDTLGARGAIHVVGNRFTFPRASGDWTEKNGRLFYVQFNTKGTWDDLPNGLGDVLTIVLGEGASLEQMTDGQGRRLYTRAAPRGLGDLDVSASGLGQDVWRIIPAGQGKAKPPERVTDVPTPVEKAMRARYASAFSGRAEVYLVYNPRLTNLKFRVNSSAKDGAARVLVAGGRQFFDVKMSGARTADLAVVATGDLNKGLLLRSSQVAAKATLTHGALRAATKDLSLQEVRQLALGDAPLLVTVTPARDLKLQGARGITTFSIQREAIDAKGLSKKLEVKKGVVDKTLPRDVFKDKGVIKPPLKK